VLRWPFSHRIFRRLKLDHASRRLGPDDRPTEEGRHFARRRRRYRWQSHPLLRGCPRADSTTPRPRPLGLRLAAELRDLLHHRIGGAQAGINGKAEGGTPRRKASLTLAVTACDGSSFDRAGELAERYAECQLEEKGAARCQRILTIEQVERVGGDVPFNRGTELVSDAVESCSRFFRPGKAN
jgi:hypothetical protein